MPQQLYNDNDDDDCFDGDGNCDGADDENDIQWLTTSDGVRGSDDSDDNFRALTLTLSK